MNKVGGVEIFSKGQKKTLGVYEEVGAVKIVQIQSGSRCWSRRLIYLQNNIGWLINLFQQIRSLKHLKPTGSLKHLYFFNHTKFWIIEATKCVEMLFKRPDSLSKVFTIPKYYSEKFQPPSPKSQPFL